MGTASTQQTLPGEVLLHTSRIGSEPVRISLPAYSIHCRYRNLSNATVQPPSGCVHCLFWVPPEKLCYRGLISTSSIGVPDYHDDQIFGQHYDQIKAHLEQLISTAKINNVDGLLTYGGWSDWCPPEGCRACWVKDSTGKRGGIDSKNSVVVSSFYYISELRIVARYAGILGKQTDQARYSALAESVAAAYNTHFYDPVKKTYFEGNRTCGESLSVQTLISLAAALDVIPAADYDAVIDNLVDDVALHDWHLDVGIVGIKYLLPTLSDAGRGDVALMIAQARTPPSYIYMVEQGATTLWETWTGSMYDPVASWNHIMVCHHHPFPRLAI